MDSNIRKRTLRLLSNGVYILTSRLGDRVGAATVTWVSQASFKPPLLMAAIRRDSSALRCLAHSLVAALHIVGSRQCDIARKFFAPTPPGPGVINGEPFDEGETPAREPLEPLTIAQSPWEYGG